MRYAMAIDVGKCIGCHTCVIACKSANNLPKGIFWNSILTIGGEAMDTPSGVYPDNRLGFLPLTCQHCGQPPCVEACPACATYVLGDGVVYQESDKCIGCGYCMVACPYTGVRQLNWVEPGHEVGVWLGDADAPRHFANTVEKCTFCEHRLRRGEKPACMVLCPARARFFGDLDDPDSDVSKAVRGRSGFRLLEEMGTSPSVFYLS